MGSSCKDRIVIYRIRVAGTSECEASEVIPFVLSIIKQRIQYHSSTRPQMFTSTDELLLHKKNTETSRQKPVSYHSL